MTLRSHLPFKRDASSYLSTRAARDPFSLLHLDINQAFEDMFQSFGRGGSSAGSADFAPQLDVSEDDLAYHVEVELPGVTEDDISLEMRDGNLVIRGEKKFESDKEDKKGFHVVERSYGSFLRTVPLGFDAPPEAVEAVFKKGVLKVSVPKPTQAQEKSRRIEIQSR
jgi:HSP20 family protein